MSVKVMSAVFDRYPNGGGEMLLALALADHADDSGARIFPGIKHLAEKTRQSERSVQYQLRRMEESGWLILVNSGNGGRSQCREYRISTPWLKGAEIAPFHSAPPAVEKGADFAPFEDSEKPGKGAEIASFMGGEKGAIHDVKGATDDVKGAIHDTKGCNPLHPHITINKPSRTTKEPKEGSASLAPFGVCDAVWEDFLKVRKAAKALMTNTALAGIEREAAKAGISLEDALKTCCERGWRSFKADWVQGSGNNPSSQPRNTNKFGPAAAAIFDGATHV